MISNYHSIDELSLDLFDKDLPHYLSLEEILEEISEELEDVYSHGYVTEEVEYEPVDFPKTTISFSDKVVEQEDYLSIEDMLSYQRPLKENGHNTVIHPAVTRMYSFLEDLIVHLMYGYLEEVEYPERDYLVYEEMDRIHGEVLPIAVA
jgi:hypothetical protein